jgi:polysaccharide export outer membrane protein
MSVVKSSKRHQSAQLWRSPLLWGGLAVSGALAAQEAPAPSLRMSGELATVASARPIEPRPAGEATARGYRIGTEDLLEVQVFGIDQLTRTVRVNSQGLVSLPLIGSVAVGGLTAQQAEALVVSRYAANYLQDPQVSLFIKEYTSQRVIVEGAVNRPGVYPVRGSTTLLQVLAMAGGQGALSDMKEVMIFRGDGPDRKETFKFDVERIRKGEIPDPVVLNEDLVVVRRSEARVVFKDSVLHDMLEFFNPFR